MVFQCKALPFLFKGLWALSAGTLRIQGIQEQVLPDVPRAVASVPMEASKTAAACVWSLLRLQALAQGCAAPHSQDCMRL